MRDETGRINMEVYLIRHGIAADPTEYSNDSDRPLTKEGKQKTERVAKNFFKLGLRFELILTSPLLRARQTAEILQNFSLSDRLEEFAALAPGGDIQEWLHWLLEKRYNNSEGSIALVGHQPDLGNWAEILVWGSSTQKLVVKKTGTIGVRLPQENPVGNSELFLLTSPKWSN